MRYIALTSSQTKLSVEGVTKPSKCTPLSSFTLCLLKALYCLDGETERDVLGDWADLYRNTDFINQGHTEPDS